MAPPPRTDQAPDDAAAPPLRDRRPGLYASRHVAGAVLKVALGVLGVGAVLRGLLPRLDWLRDWNPRALVSWIPDPLGWAWDRLGLSVPETLADIARPARWGLTILIAVAVALTEYERRRRANEDDHGESASPTQEGGRGPDG